MTFPEVLQTGDDFLVEYPRNSLWWKAASYSTTMFTVGVAKVFLNCFYDVKVNNLNKLESALNRAHEEGRGLMTMMNHMSTVDDPFVWATLPLKMYKNLQNIRWCLGAHNVCFKNKFVSTYFSLGQVLSTQRFGVGPFQPSIDAMIRLLSPEDTLNSHLDSKTEGSMVVRPHFKMTKPAWVHVYPEGFVLQLQPPYSNSMRYFKWGVTRLILESTVPPILVPIFTTGFEKIAPEDFSEDPINRYLPNNYGAEINVTIGDAINDKIIYDYRSEWEKLVEKYKDPSNPNNLSDELKFGKEAQDLRSRVAATLREHVADIRHNERGFPQEDPRLKSPQWWRRYTETEGASDPDVKFIGKNWAIRRLQKFLLEEEKIKDLEKKGGK